MSASLARAFSRIGSVKRTVGVRSSTSSVSRNASKNMKSSTTLAQRYLRPHLQTSSVAANLKSVKSIRAFTTQAVEKTTSHGASMTVDSLHTIRLVLPLPQAGDTVFVLKMKETLGDLLAEIRSEDASIGSLVFFYEDGKRVAHTTTVEDLTKSVLKVQLNDAVHELRVPDLLEVKNRGLESGVLTVDDLDTLVQRGYFYKLRRRCEQDQRHSITVDEFYRWAAEYSVDQASATTLLRALHTAAVVQHFESNEKLKQYIFLKPDELLFSVADTIGLKMLSKGDGTNLAALARVQEQIAALDAEKLKYDAIARKSANRLMYALFGYLLLQFGVLADMVWIDFNWDIMEPITYFVTLTTVIGGFSFFIKSKADYTYPALAQRFANAKLRKLYIDNRFNYKAWSNLNQERSDLQQKLGIAATPNKN